MERPVNHWCAVCGKGYFACDSCLKNTSFTPWRSLTCTAGHFQIFMVLQDYRNQRITRSEARELLWGNSLSGREDFKDSIKTLLDEILCGDELSVEGKSEAGQPDIKAPAASGR